MRTLLILACSSALALAQMPRFVHAQVQTQPAASDLAAQMRAAEQFLSPRWWGYAVPATDAHMGDCGIAYLEGDRRDQPQADSGQQPLLVVLYRLGQGKLDQLRTLSPTCQVDAGGLPVIWLSGVPARQSVALLAELVHTDASFADRATAAIALTVGNAAEQAIESFTAASEPEALRERAAFWLGVERGHAGFLALQRLARTDASQPLRRRVTFALSQSHDPGALAELIRMAKSDASPNVRGQALFWLAQKAGRQAEAAITDAVRNDPDTAVKKRAVFGLSQLPPSQGVPLLIQVAETNPNPAVRKQAMFWLGQSRDPCALDFFRRVLEKP